MISAADASLKWRTAVTSLHRNGEPPGGPNGGWLWSPTPIVADFS